MLLDIEFFLRERANGTHRRTRKCDPLIEVRRRACSYWAGLVVLTPAGHVASYLSRRRLLLLIMSPVRLRRSDSAMSVTMTPLA